MWKCVCVWGVCTHAVCFVLHHVPTCNIVLQILYLVVQPQTNVMIGLLSAR